MDELRMLSVRLPVELHQWVRARAVEEDVSVQEFVTRVFEGLRSPNAARDPVGESGRRVEPVDKSVKNPHLEHRESLVSEWNKSGKVSQTYPESWGMSKEDQVKRSKGKK